MPFLVLLKTEKLEKHQKSPTLVPVAHTETLLLVVKILDARLVAFVFEVQLYGIRNAQMQITVGVW